MGVRPKCVSGRPCDCRAVPVFPSLVPMGPGPDSAGLPPFLRDGTLRFRPHRALDARKEKNVWDYVRREPGLQRGVRSGDGGEDALVGELS